MGSVKALGNSAVYLYHHATALVAGRSKVVANDHSYVEARDDASVEAFNNSSITLHY